jgi:hypothetical protein
VASPIGEKPIPKELRILVAQEREIHEQPAEPVRVRSLNR